MQHRQIRNGAAARRLKALRAEHLSVLELISKAGRANNMRTGELSGLLLAGIVAEFNVANGAARGVSWKHLQATIIP